MMWLCFIVKPLGQINNSMVWMVNILNAIFDTTPVRSVHNEQQSSDIVILRPRGQQNKNDPFSSPQNRIMTCAHCSVLSVCIPSRLYFSVSARLGQSWIKTLQWILEIWCWWWWAGLVGRDLTFQLLEKSKLSAVWNMTFSFNKENFWKYFSTKFGLFD